MKLGQSGGNTVYPVRVETQQQRTSIRQVDWP